jgi:N-acetylneuraminate synthase/N,N'-diacetyllegionaminate synthase
VIIGTHDTAQRPLLIAEIGNNHEGDASAALELADAAVEAGADAVKVQIIDPARVVNISQTERIAQLTRFRLEPEVFREMARRVRKRGRLFMASVFDCTALSLMHQELDAIKIASGDLDFDPLLEIAAESGRPIILSTGMSTMEEIVRAVGVIGARSGASAALADRLAVLHCVSLYPTPVEQANLAAIPQIAARLGITVGYSDHTLGTDAALVALALGARIIEKHFTLDKKRSSFRDHALSAEPQELARLAAAMRTFDAMLGTGGRDEVTADAATRAVARRSVVAARELARGTTLQAEDLDYVRPAGGVPPSQTNTLLGRRLRRAVAQHELIKQTDVE